MTVGFEVVSSRGTLQISDSVFNYALSKKVQLTLTSFGPNFYQASLYVTGGNPIVAVSGSSVPVSVSRTISGGQFNFGFLSYSSTTINVFVFDRPAFATPMYSLGLLVRNPSTGEVAFDSRLAQLIVASFNQVTVPASYVASSAPPTQTFDAGAPNLAVVIAQAGKSIGYYVTSTQDAQGNINISYNYNSFLVSANVVGTTCYYSGRSYSSQSYSSAAENLQPQSARLLLIDTSTL